ncbi:MAG: type I secretion outer membrane protein [uncultured bacterium]|nr:MAG: type I secretion outer membrane protein [uncultured bacterium]
MCRLVLFFILLYVSFASYAATSFLRTLSLDEAILLSVRENPNVETSQLNHVLQKFALEVQQWQFQPHFMFQATHTTSRTYSVTPGGVVTSNVTGIQPSVSLLTPIGTNLTLTSTNNVGNHYNPGLSLQIMQPLLRGFGKPIVEAALYNAMDSETISRLSVEGTLRSTVTAVINAYLDLMSAEHTLMIDTDALVRAEESVRQTELFIKAGHKAGVELVTVKADRASAEMRIETDKNRLDQVRSALLTTIGIDPNTKVRFDNHIDVEKLIKKYRIPTLNESKQMILKNDIQYQTDQITLQGTVKRSVLAAEDATRWQLNLTVNSAVGNGSGGGQSAGINSLVNGVNETNSALLNLTIPIDDRQVKLSLASAKIALREAEIALRQEKWNKETAVIDGWNAIYSAVRAERFAAEAAELQGKTYQISMQKYTYGLIDSLELQTAQQQLSAAQQSSLDAKINYLKTLVNLDLLMGTTLKTWNIQVKYL